MFFILLLWMNNIPLHRLYHILFFYSSILVWWVSKLFLLFIYYNQWCHKHTGFCVVICFYFTSYVQRSETAKLYTNTLTIYNIFRNFKSAYSLWCLHHFIFPPRQFQIFLYSDQHLFSDFFCCESKQCEVVSCYSVFTAL